MLTPRPARGCKNRDILGIAAVYHTARTVAATLGQKWLHVGGSRFSAFPDRSRHSAKSRSVGIFLATHPLHTRHHAPRTHTHTNSSHQSTRESVSCCHDSFISPTGQRADKKNADKQRPTNAACYLTHRRCKNGDQMPTHRGADTCRELQLTVTYCSTAEAQI